jgi:endopolyphosphatase
MPFRWCPGFGLAVVLLCHGVIAGQTGLPGAADGKQGHFQLKAAEPAPAPAPVPRKLHGRFLHLTDFHPDEFYKVHSSTKENDACHRGDGPAGIYGAETSDCDTPVSLVNATFDWIAANVRDQVDFVVWTGDSARHDSDEAIPRSSSQVLGSNRWMSEKFADLFSNPTGDHRAIPVIPTLGNNDIWPHNILMPGPNKLLQAYKDMWQRFIPEEQRHSFEFGGWFYVEVVPNKLAVFSMNTLYFFDRNAGVDDCRQPEQPGYKQMEWLRVQLQFMRQRGMKAILMGHVPPARTESKQLWDESCWQKYTLWLRQYRDVVVGALYGHMNIDHFLLQDTDHIDTSLFWAEENQQPRVREAMGDELSAQSTADYLQELRTGWSSLPPPTTFGAEWSEDESSTGGKKKKKKLDKWAERYQLSFVSPSIVPNYFPTIRIIEYNISGLEDTPVWADVHAQPAPRPLDEDDAQRRLELRAVDPASEAETSAKKKPKKGKDKKPKPPSFVVPDPPSKSSPPGPAYSPQPLSFTGFTQYYANLTHINNDMTPDDGEAEFSQDSSWADWLLRWRQGKHGGKKWKSPKLSPRVFKFEVEYSTFTDKVYNLTDLTVKSFVELAYRMGQHGAEGKDFPGDDIDDSDDTNDVVAPSGEDNEEVPELDDEAAALETLQKNETKKKGNNKDKTDDKNKNKDKTGDKTGGKTGDKTGDKNKKKKGKHGKAIANKTWMHFLRYVFVSTVETRDLKKMS